MPATTTRGYPYPLGTDRLMDGDDAIHSLADAVDTKLGTTAAGSIALTMNTYPVLTAVTFPSGRFGAIPVIVCSGSHGDTTAGAANITLTGFNFVALQRSQTGDGVTGGTSRIGYWIAREGS